MTDQLTRRQMLGVAGGALLAGSLAGASTARPEPPQTAGDPRARARATAMTTFTKSLWAHLPNTMPTRADVAPVLDKWAEAGFTLLLLYVKDGQGRVAYRDSSHPIQPIAEDWDPLETIAEEARRRGMRVHPWTAVFVGAESDLARRHPGLIGRNRAGDPRGGFLCTGQDAVHDWAFSYYEELMERYDVAGVHMDYIRYNGNFCWCDHCRGLFRRETGVEMEDAEPGGAAWARWVTGRVHHVNRFVRRLSDAADGAGMEVSAAVLTDYPAVVARIGQDWLTWSRERWVDFMMPMNYWSDEKRFWGYAERHKAGIDGEVPLLEGVAKFWSQERFDVSPEHIYNRTAALKERGYQGVVYFSAGRLTDEDLALIGRI